MVKIHYLYKCLRQLRATGPCGLEGLACSLLEAWTGQRFFLAKSGSQAGRDMSAERLHGNLIKIAAEIKQYGEKTDLSKRELLGELTESVEDLSQLDLWVLIATTEVADQVSTALQKTSDRRGVETLIIDARNEGLGYIDVFFSEYPELTVNFCVDHAEDTDRQRLQRQLEGIRKAPSYGNGVDQLRATLSGKWHTIVQQPSVWKG